MTLVAAACSSSSKSSSPTTAATGGSGGGGSSPNGAPITIPVVIGLSGAAAPFGMIQLNATKLAVNEINAKGGVNGHLLKLVTKDDQSNPTQSVANTRLLAPSYPFVVLMTLSTNTEQDLPVLKQLKVPGIAPSLSVTSAATQNQPWAFDTYPVFTGAYDAGAKYLVSTKGLTSVSLIYNNQDAASTSQGKAFFSSFQKAGASTGSIVQVSNTSVDFGSAVAQAISSHPKAVIIGALPNEAASIVNSLHNASPSTQIVLTQGSFDATVLSKSASSAAAGLITVTPWYPDESPGSTTFVQNYQKQYGSVPGNGTAATSYELVYILAAAAQSGIPLWENTAAVRQQVQKYFANLNYNGVFGNVTMTSGGFPKRTSYVIQLDPKLNITQLTTVNG